MNIQPFQIEIPESHLQDLKMKLQHVRWPHDLPETGWERGVPAAYLKRLVDYWQTTFDWRKMEAMLNAFPQFQTKIDGQTIHFIHVRSQHPNALPLLLTHGYPSSTVEFTQVIDALTNPTLHGGHAADAFDVVIPSLPGFGFSAPLSEKGWALGRTAKAWAELMKELGYERYGAHGGDIGGGIAGMLAIYDIDHIIGIHILSDPTAASLIGMPLDIAPNQLTEQETKHLQKLKDYQNDGRGYLQIQSTRPMTLSYGLADSPVAQLAWIIEKFKEWVNPAKTLPEEAIDRDLLLTNVCIYWFTGTGTSAAQFIYEAFHSHDWPRQSTVPQGWAVFGTNDSIMQRLLNPEKKITHWSEFAEGGHFPALEVPGLLVGDLRKFFSKLRTT